MLYRAVKYHPLARNIIKRALKDNPTDGVKALKALYKKYSPEARSAEISIMFNSYAQRGAPIQSLAGAGPGPQRTSTHSTISAIQIHLT